MRAGPERLPGMARGLAPHLPCRHVGTCRPAGTVCRGVRAAAPLSPRRWAPQGVMPAPHEGRAPRRGRVGMEHARGRSRGSESEGRRCEPSPRRRVVVDLPKADKSTDSRMFQHICTFHLMVEVTKAVLGAVASARKGLTAQRPTLRRGRPSTPAAKQAVRTKKRRFVHGGCTTLRHACPASADALRSLCGKISLAPWRQRPVPGTRGVVV